MTELNSYLDRIHELATSIAGMIGSGPDPVVGSVSYSKDTYKKQKEKNADYRYKYRKARGKYSPLSEGLLDYVLLKLADTAVGKIKKQPSKGMKNKKV